MRRHTSMSRLYEECETETYSKEGTIMERAHTKNQVLGQVENGRVQKGQLHLPALWNERPEGKTRATPYPAEGTLQEQSVRCEQRHHSMSEMPSVYTGTPQEGTPARQEVASNRRQKQEGDEDESC